MISLEKWQILTPLQKLPKNVVDLGKLIVAKGFKSFPKSNKLPNLVTLVTPNHFINLFITDCCSNKEKRTNYWAQGQWSWLNQHNGLLKSYPIMKFLLKPVWSGSMRPLLEHISRRRWSAGSAPRSINVRTDDKQLHQNFYFHGLSSLLRGPILLFFSFN